MRRFPILFPILLIGLVGLVNAYARRPRPQPILLPSALKNAAELQITAERNNMEVDVYAVAPDGRSFVTVMQGKICTGSTETFQALDCFEVGRSSYIDRASVTWSPDSTRIAFTQSISDDSIHSIAYRQNKPGTDTDIWVLDVNAHTLTDLTDAPGSAHPAGSTIDTQPGWSPDGKTLAFIRSDNRKDGSTALYTIAARGGKAKHLLTVNDHGAFSVIGKLHWTAEGKRIVYAAKFGISATYPEDGIWIVDKNGKHPRQLAGNLPRWNTPVVLDVSTKHAIALVDYYWGYWPEAWTPNDCYVFLLDLDSGDLTPLKQPASQGKEFYSPMEALFSPDGSKVLYFYIQYENAERRLALLDVTGGSEALLYTSKWFLSSDFWHNYPTLFWGENDTIYAVTDFSDGWLLTVGNK